MAKEREVSDLALVEEFCRGSIAAFEELLTRYEVKVYNLALRFTRNQDDAEEVLQEVFTTLYRKLHAFEGKSAFSSWLYRIVANTAFMRLRKKRQSMEMAIDDLPERVRHLCHEVRDERELPIDAISEARELREAMLAAVNRLPEQYRLVFILKDMEGLSNQEVGRIMDLTVPAVKSRLHRSRLMLRRKLHRLYEEYTGNRAPEHEEVVGF